jgi:hypothetical protein
MTAVELGLAYLSGASAGAFLTALGFTVARVRLLERGGK